MPRARQITAIAVNPGLRSSSRTANRKSRARVAISGIYALGSKRFASSCRCYPIHLMTAKWPWLAVAAVVIGVAAGALSIRHRRPAQAPVSSAAAAVSLPASLTLNGKIRAAHVIGVAAQVPGNIDAFSADVGDEVTQGQELASVGG